MHASTDHVVGQDRGIELIGGNGRDDIRTFNNFLNILANDDIQTGACKIARAFFRSTAVKIIKTQLIDAENCFEC